MDGQRFDALTRSLAFGASRRALLKAAAAAVAASLLPGGRGWGARAAGVYCGVTCAASGQNCEGATDGCSTCCDPLCADTSTDPNNCGSCGRVCPGAPYASCGDGVCGLDCPAGLSVCGDGASRYCADLGVDVYNCQSCGTACTPPSDACCPGVGCVWLAEDDSNCGVCGNACGQDMRCCNGQCIDPSTNGQFCGSCEITCAADQICRRGVCAARCPAGQILCGPDCVDPAADRANCGGCGAACAPGEVCQRSSCVSTCAAGTTDCGGICANLTTDQNNCGACANACSRETVCQNGVCVRPQPPGNTRNCPDGQTGCQDGCVDVKTDANHCGGCSNVCIGTLSCCGGSCFDLKIDPNHCGSCDRACPPGYTCEGTACVFRSSETGIVSSRQIAFPELCQVSARPYTDLRALIDGAATPTPKPQVAWATIAKGAGKRAFKRADATLTEAIRQSVVQVSACGNANDPARQTALMTDEMAGRWLADRGVTGSILDAASATTPAPLPTQSWQALGVIGKVYSLGKDLASALVTFEPPAATIPGRREVHLFTQRGDRWLLHSVQPADAVDSQAGGVSSFFTRLFDCPAGASPVDPGTPCAPTPELQFDYALTSEDGSVKKSLADALYREAGVLEWPGLPPNRYRLTVSGTAGTGVTVVSAGPAGVSGADHPVAVTQRDVPAIVDLYHEKGQLSDFLLALKPGTSCPPCNRMNRSDGICVPTCPPCSACRTMDIGSGRLVSGCRSTCRGDQVCDPFAAGKCCEPVGGACKGAYDCCERNCVNGFCACGVEGTVCYGPGSQNCCAGFRCANPAGPNGVPMTPVPGATVSCTACKSVGASCTANAECCDGACSGGFCRCCADDCIGGAGSCGAKTTKLCCEYPQELLTVPDTKYGPGFTRCCLRGVDCVGDPQGPPADVPRTGSAAMVCR